jgi:cell wall assembly regulator SMI1
VVVLAKKSACKRLNMAMTTNQSEALWDRIDAALQLRATNIYGQLNPPADKQQIADAEKELGLLLPQDVRDAYLRHNGTRDANKTDVYVPCFFLGHLRWCSLEEMVADWKRRVIWDVGNRARNPDIYPDWSPYWETLKVRPEFWNRHWIPMALSLKFLPI